MDEGRMTKSNLEKVKVMMGTHFPEYMPFEEEYERPIEILELSKKDSIKIERLTPIVRIKWAIGTLGLDLRIICCQFLSLLPRMMI